MAQTVYGVQGVARASSGTSQAIDWNGDDFIDAWPVAGYVNWITSADCQEFVDEPLTGYADWSYLWHDFRASGDYADGASPSADESQELTRRPGGGRCP